MARACEGSWCCLPEYRGLADQPADARVDEIEREREGAVVACTVCDREVPRAQPRRPCDAPAEQLDEIAGAAEDERARLDMHAEGHADAVADIFLEPGRAGETLGRMNDLREAGAARVKARPVLAAAAAILGDGDDRRDVAVAPERQRSADQARRLRQAPAGAAHARLADAAHIDDR